MLSGIGDPAALSRVGIKSLVNLPSVGQNMSDHVILSNSFQINPKVRDTFQDYEDPANLPNEISQWAQNRTGPLSEPGFRQLAWLRLPKDDAIFRLYSDPTAGPRSAHFQFIIAVRFYPSQSE
jgi:choline dehydrogenase-like flavoprotein